MGVEKRPAYAGYNQNISVGRRKIHLQTQIVGDYLISEGLEKGRVVYKITRDYRTEIRDWESKNSVQRLDAVNGLVLTVHMESFVNIKDTFTDDLQPSELEKVAAMLPG